MDHDRRGQLASDLRRLADLIESLPIDTALTPEVNVYYHHVHSLPELQAVMRDCASVKAESADKVGPWIKGHFGSLEVAAFYRPGLLGTTRKKRVRVVEVDKELTVDLSLLAAD